MPKRSSKKRKPAKPGPKDLNQMAARIMRKATGQEPEDAPTMDWDSGKDPAAVELGRKGGLKGGKARAAKLSAKKRSEIAKKAARSRWNKTSPD